MISTICVLKNTDRSPYIFLPFLLLHLLLILLLVLLLLLLGLGLGLCCCVVHMLPCYMRHKRLGRQAQTANTRNKIPLLLNSRAVCALRLVCSFCGAVFSAAQRRSAISAAEQRQSVSRNASPLATEGGNPSCRTANSSYGSSTKAEIDKRQGLVPHILRFRCDLWMATRTCIGYKTRQHLCEFPLFRTQISGFSESDWFQSRPVRACVAGPDRPRP